MEAPQKIPPRLEEAIERFEVQARAGRSPAIESVLTGLGMLADAERTALLTELVAIDLEYRWQTLHRRGPLLELYVKRLGQWASLDQLPLELIGEEYRARQRFGDRPTHADYLARFPHHGQLLLAELTRVDDELAAEYPELPRSNTTPFGEAAAVRDSLDYRDFAIRRLIATGGMSRVFTAIQKSRQRPVALKVLNKPLVRRPLSVQRFLREARIAASLDMPHVVNALGLGRFPDGGYFMAMPLVDGLDLARLAADKPVEPPRALALMREIVRIVAQLHHAGWLHCDLKPSNVIVDSRGAPWLADFAMAQPIRSGDGTTRDDDHFALGGTPAFMAPEQRAGDAALLSRATDIYALGGIWHYLLAGRPPPDDEKELSTFPFHTAAVLGRCLAKTPGDRYECCAALLAEVESLSPGGATKI